MNADHDLAVAIMTEELLLLAWWDSEAIGNTGSNKLMNHRNVLLLNSVLKGMHRETAL